MAVAAGTLYTAAARVWTGALAVAVTALLARALGPEGRGTYAALVLFSTIGALVGSVGLDHAAASLSAQRLSVALAAVRRGGAAAAFSALLLVLASLIWTLLGLPTPFGAVRPAFALAALGIPVGVMGLVYGGALRGLNQLRTWNLGLMVEPAILAAALAALWLTGAATVTTALCAWLGAQLVRVGFLGWRLHWGFPHRSTAAAAGWSFVGFGLKVWVSQIVGMLNTRLDYFILLSVAGAAQLGQYSTAVPVAEITTLGAAGLASAVLPRFAVLDRQESALLAFRAIRLALWSALVIGSGLAILVPLVTPLLFGPAFQAAVRPALILLPGYLLWSSVHVTTVYFIGAAHRPLINLWIALLATMIDIPLAYLLGSRHGAAGAALGSTIAYGTAAVVNGFVFVRVSRSSIRQLATGLDQDMAAVRGLLGRQLSP